MIKYKHFTALTLLLSLLTCQTLANSFPNEEGDYFQTKQLDTGQTLGFGLHLPKNVDKRQKMPLIVALHFGFQGEEAPLEYGFQFMQMMMSSTFKNAIIIAPSALTQGWHLSQNADAILGLMAEIKAHYPINESKILLTGYSAGGYGVWSLGADYQEHFSGLMPISGAPRYWVEPDSWPATPEEIYDMVDAMPKIEVEWQIPVYAIHSNADQNVPIRFTQDYVDQLNENNNQSLVQLKVLDDLAHFDFLPFMDQAKQGYGVLEEIWELND